MNSRALSSHATGWWQPSLREQESMDPVHHAGSTLLGSVGAGISPLLFKVVENEGSSPRGCRPH
jgi:hypothetical protein